MLKGEAQRLLGSALKGKARAAQLEADRNLILIEHMRKSQGFN